jgi:hypothetical protein
MQTYRSRPESGWIKAYVECLLENRPHSRLTVFKLKARQSRLQFC